MGCCGVELREFMIGFCVVFELIDVEFGVWIVEVDVMLLGVGGGWFLFLGVLDVRFSLFLMSIRLRFGEVRVCVLLRKGCKCWNEWWEVML